MKVSMRRILCAIFLIAVVFGSARASAEKELTAPQAEEYQRLTHALIAPCCWREPIAIHRSDEALQMLDEVEQLVAQGRSESDIKAIYVARYGDRILADPPGAAGHWLYLIPVVLCCLMMAAAAARLRSLVSHPAGPRSSASPDVLAIVRKETEVW